MIGNRLGHRVVVFGMILMGLACAGSAQAQVNVVAGPIENPANDHQYFLLAPGDWHASEAVAVALGGHLVTIDDAAEQAWVFDTFGAWDGIHRSLWIGLHDSEWEGQFLWADGAPRSFSNWLPGQPDNSPVTGGEHFVHMLNTGNEYGHPGGLWNDLASPNVVFTTFNPVCGVVEVPYPLRPTLEVTGDPPALCWRTRPGARCRVEHRMQWAVGEWAVWTVVTADATGRSCVEMTGGAGQEERYFRVVVE